MNEKETRDYLETLTKDQVIEFTLSVLENEKALREKLDKIQGITR